LPRRDGVQSTKRQKTKNLRIKGQNVDLNYDIEIRDHVMVSDEARGRFGDPVTGFRSAAGGNAKRKCGTRQRGESSSAKFHSLESTDLPSVRAGSGVSARRGRSEE
jgi:hypothetical protein